jgi:hypothetical protein
MVTHYKSADSTVDPATLEITLPPLGGGQQGLPPGLPNFGGPQPGGAPNEGTGQPAPPAFDLSQPPKFN